MKEAVCFFLCAAERRSVAVTALYVPPPFLPSPKHTNCRSRCLYKKKDPAVPVCASLKTLLQVFSECWFPWLLKKGNTGNRTSWVRRLNKKEAHWVVRNYIAREWWRQGILAILPAYFDNLLQLAKAAFITLKLWCSLKCSRSMHFVPAWRSKLPRLDQTRVVMHCC